MHHRRGAGYDIVTVDLRDMIENGNIPITADEQSDSLDTISPHGKPEWDGSFLGCAAFFPWFNNPMIQGTAYDRLYNGTLGDPVTSLGGSTGAQPVARAWIIRNHGGNNERTMALGPISANWNGLDRAGSAGFQPARGTKSP